MNQRQLAYFVCIAKSGSFSAAADTLHVAQSALSRHMKDLEEALGGALFDRGPRGVELTDSGKILLVRAEFILSQIDETRSEVRAHNKELTGSVRLIVPSSIGQVLFEPLVDCFAKRFPLLRLELSEGLWNDASNRLQTGTTDIAIMGSAVTSHAIELEPLAYEQMLLVGRRGEPILARRSVNVRALANLPLMMPRSTLETIGRFDADVAPALKVNIFVESASAIRALVASGRGYAVVPNSVLLAGPERREIAGVPIRGLEVLRQIGWLRGRPKGRGTSELAVALREQFAGFIRAGWMRTVTRSSGPPSTRSS